MSRQPAFHRSILVASMAALACASSMAQTVIDYPDVFSATVVSGTAVTASTPFNGQFNLGTGRIFQAGVVTATFRDNADPSRYVRTAMREEWLYTDHYGERMVAGDVWHRERYVYHDAIFEDPAETATFTLGGQTVTVSSPAFERIATTSTMLSSVTADTVSAVGGSATYITQHWDVYRDVYSGWSGTFSARIALTAADLADLNADGVLSFQAVTPGARSDFLLDSVVLAARWDYPPIVLPDPDPGVVIPGVPEPDSLALAVMGSVMVGWALRRQGQRGSGRA